MVNVPQVTIPDFAGTLARGEQVQASRLQALLARQGMEESQRFNAGLAELAPALATGEGPTYDSALARLVGLGRQGAALGLPLLTDRRQQREAAAFNWGGAPVAAPAVAPGGDYAARMISMESGGDPTARNPRSSATGAGQFIDSTWLQFAQANPQLFQGMSREQVLAARNNPDLSRQAVEWYRRENSAALAGQGLPANDGTAALAHRFGPQGAAALLRADPNAPIAGVVGPQVMAANPDLNGRTVGQVVGQYAQRFGGQGATVPASAAPGAAPARGGIDPAELARIEAAMGSGNPILRQRAQARLQMLQLQQRDPTDSFVAHTETIGGRQVQGQRNTRTGQFHPFPGQTGTGGDDITPSRAAGIVAELGPRVARGEITPDSPEYNRYAIAHGIATRPQQVWADDPNQPGTQRQFTIPGLQLDPARFPPPAGGVAPQGVPTVPIQDGAAPTAPAAVPAVSGGVQIGATGMSAEPPDATAVNPAGLTRQAPNSTPTGEENLSAGYARRMVEAEGLLAQAVARGYVPGNLRDAAAGAVAGGRDAGFARRAAGNAAMSTEGQLYRQAQEDWVRAKLRRESGAVIGEEEMAREIQVYFPQPGDSEAVIAQKSEARRVATEAMRQGAGRAAPTVPARAAPPDAALRRRGEEALARARRELGAGASDDAILQRARGYMQ